jgi:hypothetical protein
MDEAGLYIDSHDTTTAAFFFLRIRQSVIVDCHSLSRMDDITLCRVGFKIAWIAPTKRTSVQGL